MDLRHIVRSDYQEAIGLLPSIPSELRTSLKAHERVPLFIDNLVKEISKLPPHVRPDRHKIKQIVYSMTEFFIHNVKRQADEMAQSEAKKQAQIAEAQRLKDLDLSASGTPTGVYADVLKEVSDSSKEL